MSKNAKTILITYLFFSTLLLAQGVVESIQTPGVSEKERHFIIDSLSIQIKKPLNRNKMETGLRKLYASNRYFKIFVESDPNRVTIHAIPRTLVHSFKIEGIEPALKEEIRSKIEVPLNTELSPKDTLGIREAIKEILEGHGYFFPLITTESRTLPNGQSEFLVRIDLGTLTRVGKMRFSGVPTEEAERLQDEIPLEGGEPMDRARLDSSQDQIIKYLRKNQYPLATVDKPKLQFFEKDSRVDVEFPVQLGSKYRFDFTGNRSFSDISLRELITPDLLTQSDGIQKIADSIQKQYQTIGYHFCKVTIKTEPTTGILEVHFRVEEGPRVLIDRVGFTHLKGFSEEQWRALFFSQAVPIVRRKIYSEKGVQESLNNLKEHLLSQGYLRHSISPPKVIFSEDKRGVELLFESDMGPQTVIHSITLEGNTALSSSELLKLLPLATQQPLDKAKVEESKAILLDHYQNLGYIGVALDKTADIEISDDGRKARVHFKILEGPRYFVGTLSIEGNSRTQADVILREMKISSGNPYSPDSVRESEEDIAALGLFSRVEILSTDSKSQNNVKDLNIIVRENKPGVGEVGVGTYFEDPRFRFRGFFGVAYRNLGGYNHTLYGRTELTLPLTRSEPRGLHIPFIEYSFGAGYQAPYPFSVPVTFSTHLGLDGFEVSTQGPTLQRRARIEERLEKKLSKSITGLFRLHRFEHTSTETLQSESTAYAFKVETIGSTGPGIIFDFRDDSFNPTQGTHHTIDLEIGHPVLLGQQNIAFLMSIVRNTFFLPLYHPFSMSFFLGGGYATSLYREYALPTARLINDLSLGGQGSIRGFPPRKFDPRLLDPNNPVKDTAYYNFRSELAVLIYESLSAAVFFDTGQVFPNLKTAERNDGIGVGLRYRTPVGPLVVDIAQGLGPNRESVKFYFSVGTF